MVLEMSLRLVNILGQHYWSKSELNVWHALRQSLSVKYFVNIESEQWNYLSHIEETMNDFQISHLYFIAVLKYMRFLWALGRRSPAVLNMLHMLLFELLCLTYALRSDLKSRTQVQIEYLGKFYFINFSVLQNFMRLVMLRT